MKKKANLNHFYTLGTMSRLEKVDYIPNEEDEIMLWEEHYITIKLINMTITINTIDHESQVNDVCQNQPKYYVDMLKSHAIMGKLHSWKPHNLQLHVHTNYITIGCNIAK
jgi:hypothetical protein